MSNTGELIAEKTRFATLLNALKLTQSEFCRQTGLSTTVVNNYFNGERKVTVKSARVISQVFPNVNPDFLLEESEILFLEASNHGVERNDSADYVKMLEKYLEDTISERNRLADQNTRLVLTLERYGSRLERQSETLEQTLGQILEGLKERRRG